MKIMNYIICLLLLLSIVSCVKNHSNNYEIVKEDKNVEINIKTNDYDKEKLLEYFNNCKDGKCTCPTEEYYKIETMNINENNGYLNISLNPKIDEELNVDELSECVNYTLSNSE